MASEEKMEIDPNPFRDTSQEEDMDWQPSHKEAPGSVQGPQNGITISLSGEDNSADSDQTILTILRESIKIRAHIELSKSSNIAVTIKKSNATTAKEKC